MKVSMYLHKEVVDVLKMFGPLNEVINKIVDDNIDSCDLSALPPAPSKDNATRYNLIIDNETYEALVEHYGATSNKCAIRRLVYYFVESEMYEGWPIVREYVDDRLEYVKRRVKELKNTCKKLIVKAESEELEIANKIAELIGELEELVYGEPNK